MEKCTPDVTFIPIRNPYTYVKVHTYVLLPKMKRTQATQPGFHPALQSL